MADRIDEIRERCEVAFQESFEDIDNLNQRDGAFDYSDYVTLHNDISELLDSAAELLSELDRLKAERDAEIDVLHGEWVRPFIDKSAVQCSLCKSAYSTLGGVNFCPNCGARMVDKEGEVI